MTFQFMIEWTCDSCGAVELSVGTHGFPSAEWSCVPSDPSNRDALQNRTRLNECPPCTALREAGTPYAPEFYDWRRRHPLAPPDPAAQRQPEEPDR